MTQQEIFCLWLGLLPNPVSVVVIPILATRQRQSPVLRRFLDPSATTKKKKKKKSTVPYSFPAAPSVSKDAPARSGNGRMDASDGFLNVIKMPQIQTQPERAQLKVKKVICVIRRGAEPAVGICKPRSDVTRPSITEKRQLSNTRLPSLGGGRPSISLGEGGLSAGLSLSGPQPRTPALQSHTQRGGGTRQPPEYQ